MAPKPLLLVLLVLLTTVFISTATTTSTNTTQCWYPYGVTQSPHDFPCADPSTGHAACCNKDSYCLESGLCMFMATISRGSCTDQSWEDASCAKVCRNGTFALFASSTYPL